MGFNSEFKGLNSRAFNSRCAPTELFN